MKILFYACRPNFKLGIKSNSPNSAPTAPISEFQTSFERGEPTAPPKCKNRHPGVRHDAKDNDDVVRTLTHTSSEATTLRCTAVAALYLQKESFSLGWWWICGIHAISGTTDRHQQQSTSQKVGNPWRAAAQGRGTQPPYTESRPFMWQVYDGVPIQRAGRNPEQNRVL